MRKCIMCLLVMTLAIPISLNAVPAKGLGMWVWSNSAFSTDEDRQQLIRFCLNHNLRHLDVHVNMSADETTPILEDAEALRDLILLAGLNNITIAALRGRPKMFFFENHERTLRELRAIIAFYKTLPPDSLFKGIKYDVEPYRTKEWKARGESLKTIMSDYLNFLHKARSLLQEEAPSLWLAVDIPFWWDKTEFIMEFEGNTKRFNEHVQDLTDFIVVMSYRRNVNKVLDCVENERRYAEQNNKVIFPSLETVELKHDPHISFWESPSQVFWGVVPELLGAVEEYPAIGGVMLHCYRSLAARFNKTFDKTGGRGSTKKAGDLP